MLYILYLVLYALYRARVVFATLQRAQLSQRLRYIPHSFCPQPLPPKSFHRHQVSFLINIHFTSAVCLGIAVSVRLLMSFFRHCNELLHHYYSTDQMQNAYDNASISLSAFHYIFPSIQLSCSGYLINTCFSRTYQLCLLEEKKQLFRCFRTIILS